MEFIINKKNKMISRIMIVFVVIFTIFFSVFIHGVGLHGIDGTIVYACIGLQIFPLLVFVNLMNKRITISHDTITTKDLISTKEVAIVDIVGYTKLYYKGGESYTLKTEKSSGKPNLRVAYQTFTESDVLKKWVETHFKYLG